MSFEPDVPPEPALTAAAASVQLIVLASLPAVALKNAGAPCSVLTDEASFCAKSLSWLRYAAIFGPRSISAPSWPPGAVSSWGQLGGVVPVTSAWRADELSG